MKNTKKEGGSENLLNNPKDRKNLFLERTIENWLETVNELGYQMPFSQILLSKGFSVCHNSKHNAFEQGKDVIAIDENKVPNAFQLKAGDITLKKWREEVKPEIEGLIDLKIEHPSVDKTKSHISWLVTNGNLEDTVRREIDNLNHGKWKTNPLKTITYGELLNEFVKLSEEFTPKKINDYKSFLDLYFSNGRELIDEKKLTNFISNLLDIDNPKLTKQRIKQNIATAVLYIAYISSSFKKENNYISVIQVMVLLCSHIFALVEKNNLNEEYWVDSFNIIWNEILANGNLLQEEINNKGLLVGTVQDIWDGEISPYRKYLATSYLLAFKITQALEGNHNWNDIDFTKISESLYVWGETSLFSFILLFLYVNKMNPDNDKISSAEKELKYKPLINALDFALQSNKNINSTGLFSPYYSINTVIKSNFGLLDEPIDENFRNRSFVISSIIDLLVRHEIKKEVEERWEAITHIVQEAFVPKELWHNFIWRCKEGKNISSFPNQTQSWKELLESANQINTERIPEILKKQTFFLPLFLLVYPHRINNEYIKFLDEIIV